MSTIKKIYGTYELNGSTERVRIGLKSKLQYETTARARKWPAVDEAPFQAQAFWTWHASKEKGLHDLSYEAFIDQVDDVVVDDGEEDSEGNETLGQEI